MEQPKHRHALMYQYERLKQRLSRTKSISLSPKKKQQLHRRLQNYERHLARIAGTATLLGLSSSLSQAQTFTRILDKSSPFVYLDVDPFTPFGLGDVGRASTPSVVDIDGDGDFDVFIGEYYGRLNYYENIGKNDAPLFSLSNDRQPFGITGVDIYSTPDFVDIDADGDFDVFIGARDGSIKYFENIGNSTAPDFVLSSSSEPFGLSNVISSAAPTFTDIDADGDLDAFVGNIDGDTRYFENIGNSTAPNFSRSNSSEPFGLSNVGYLSAPTFVDIDADGDLDALFGEYSGNINYFENTGNSTAPSFSLSSSSEPFGLIDVGYYSKPDFVDIDADGDLDVFVGEMDGNINYYENTSTDSSIPAFTPPCEDVGYAAAPALVDIDGDSDLDLFVGEFYVNVNYYENVGNNSNVPNFEIASTSEPFGIVEDGGESHFSFVDIDGDGDFDAFKGQRNGEILYYENVGDSNNPAFSLLNNTEPFGLADVGFYSKPDFVDIDGDGDFDAFVGEFDGNMNFFENIGSSSAPNFGPVNSNAPFGLTDLFRYSSPTFVDIDVDGDLDAFIGEDFGRINFFENTGSSTNPAFTKSTDSAPFGLIPFAFRPVPAILDIDGDGFYEAIVGDLEGKLSYFESDIPTTTNNNIVIDSDTYINGQEEEICDVDIIRSTATVNAGADVTYSANEMIVLEAGFQAIQGSDFLARIGNCLNDVSDQAIEERSDKENLDHFVTDQTVITVFPVPTHTTLNYNVHQVEGIKAIYLFDVMGRLVKTDRELDGTIDVSDLPNGQYTLVFEGEKQRVHHLIQKL